MNMTEIFRSVPYSVQKNNKIISWSKVQFERANRPRTKNQLKRNLNGKTKRKDMTISNINFL